MSDKPNNPVDAPFPLRPGAAIAWREAQSRQSGRILQIHTGYVEREIDGEPVERWGSKARPVIEAETDDGGVRLLVVSDLLPPDGD